MYLLNQEVIKGFYLQVLGFQINLWSLSVPVLLDWF